MLSSSMKLNIGFGCCSALIIKDKSI
eukprot:UN04338